MNQKFAYEKNSSNRAWDDAITTDVKNFNQKNSNDTSIAYKQTSGQRNEFNTKTHKESIYSDTWLTGSNRSLPNGHENYHNLDDNNTTDSTGSDDDAEDEDWVASDYDKKRSSRASRTQTTSSRKTLNGCSSHRKTSYTTDRSQRRFGGSLSRTNHYNSGSNRIVSSNKSSSKSTSRPKNINRTVHTSSSSRKVNNTRRTDKAEKADTNPQKVSDPLIPNELKNPRQCFGPGCTRPAARPDTKYCSHECGLKLAIRRLETLLPESFKTWYPDLLSKDRNTLSELVKLPDCMATVIDKSRLEEISKEQCAVHNRLIELEMEHQKLTTLINHAQERKTGRNNEQMLAAVAQDVEQVEQMEPIVCVTCSAEISMRHALKHMEKCFQKMEGNTVFCANQKEQIMGTPLFCDAYDSQARAYCKRLRVVCEHYKEPKLPADTVCGSPLVRNVFEETGEFCCVPRNKCTKHVGWERLRRAKIDLERYRCLIQMDELMQEEQRLQRAMSQRGGRRGILLHQTIDHNPQKPIPIPKDVKRSLKIEI